MKNKVLVLFFGFFLSGCGFVQDTESEKIIKIIRNTNERGCRIGEKDARKDIKNKTLNHDYHIMKEIKFDSFDVVFKDYEEKNLRFIFALSARSCYLNVMRHEEVRKMSKEIKESGESKE